MPYQTKATRSNRFILSASGIAIIAVVMLIATPRSRANIAGMNSVQTLSTQQISHTNMHAMFLTGDVDFDYAANMRIHQKLAVEMSQAQLRNGKNPKMRSMAAKIIAAQNKDVVLLDRWLVAQSKVKPKSLLSAK